MKMLKISANTLTRLKREGLPFFSIGKPDGKGSRPRFDLDKVSTWLEARTKADKVQDTPMTDRADLMEQSRAAVARLEARQAAKNRKETK